MFTAGQTIFLNGGSMASGGPDRTSFAWYVDFQPVGDTQNASTILGEVGPHTVMLVVGDGGLFNYDLVNIVVVADTDRDSLPDDYELAHCLNPLAPDAEADRDRDGLSNRLEHEWGINPCRADTDGDHYNDAEELAAGTDPTRPDSPFYHRLVFPLIAR
jgi:hypothetical protein